MKKAKSIYKGIIFEYIACYILLIKGYKILKRNFKRKNTAQIDILAQKHKNQIILCEVKYRKKFDNAIIAISPSQKQRIYKTAQTLQKQYKCQVQIDAMFFYSHFPFFTHKKNI